MIHGRSNIFEATSTSSTTSSTTEPTSGIVGVVSVLRVLWERNSSINCCLRKVEQTPVLFIGPIRELVVFENECVWISSVGHAVVGANDIIGLMVISLSLLELTSGEVVFVVSSSVLVEVWVHTELAKATGVHV